MHCLPNLKMGKILTEKCDYLYIGLNQSYWGKKKKKEKKKISFLLLHVMYCTSNIISLERLKFFLLDT